MAYAPHRPLPVLHFELYRHSYPMRLQPIPMQMHKKPGHGSLHTKTFFANASLSGISIAVINSPLCRLLSFSGVLPGQAMKICKWNSAFSFAAAILQLLHPVRQCNTHITWMHSNTFFRCAEDRMHSIVSFQCATTAVPAAFYCRA